MEQVQLYFSDGNGMIYSYYNVTLIYDKDSSKVDIKAYALAGKEIGMRQVF